jgi:hypothetical protein
MPRFANYPTTIEDVKTISLTKLKQWNYLTNGTKTGVISWSRNGIVHSTINILIVFNEFEKYVILDYKCNGTPFNLKVRLNSKNSNLGKGQIYYFVCPITGKHCRKLYFNNSHFAHREAFTGLMYQNQIESKKSRFLLKIFDKVYLSDEVYEQRYKKYFKTHYNGKPTKRYLKLESKIKTAESYPVGTLERLMLM